MANSIAPTVALKGEWNKQQTTYMTSAFLKSALELKLRFLKIVQGAMRINMKKSLLTIIAIAGMFIYSNSQIVKTDFREKFYVGLKLGANSSNVYATQGENFKADPKFGFATGAFLAIPFGKLFGIQPEVLISQKGFRATGTIVGGNYNITRTTSYIDVPILFALKPSGLFTVLAGPQFSYLLKQNNEFANATTGIEQQQEFGKETTRKNTVGFILGADVTLRHFVLGVRAGWDLQNNKDGGSSTTPTYKNRWYQFTIGYRLYSN
jgi:hypothetical protein